MLSQKTKEIHIRDMITMDNKDYARQYVLDRGLKNKTYTKILTILDHYSNFQGMSIDELIQEADQEEEQGIRWKRRKLKHRLINYMNYCKQEMLLSSAKSYFTNIKGFYLHHEIEIGALPKWNNRNANLPEPITSKDLLTKEIIREALKITTPVMRCIILTEASSGMTRSDVLGLKVSHFIDATYPFHHSNNIREAVDIMLEKDMDIVPTFRLRRAKNNKYFITFISPEATMEICKYLKLRDKRNHKYHRPLLSNVDPLFKIHPSTYIDKFTELNNSLNRGKAGTYGQFRGHNLRKFHASMLEKHGMQRYLINVLQGKSNSGVDDVYFFEDEETLREEYLKALQGVLIYTDVKEITKYSVEYLELKNENQEYKDNLNELWNELNNMKKRTNIWEEMKQ